MVKKFFSLVLIVILSHLGYGQTIDFERQNIGRFIQRMYENTPYEGVQLMNTGSHQYVVAVLSLDSNAYNNVSDMHRVATVKANSMISKYQNGSQIESIPIQSLRYDSDSLVVVKTSTEHIKEVSIGRVKAVELLYTFKMT